LVSEHLRSPFFRGMDPCQRVADVRNFEAASCYRLDIPPLKMRTRLSRNVEQPITKCCCTMSWKNAEINCTAVSALPISGGSRASQSANQWKRDFPRYISPPETKKFGWIKSSYTCRCTHSVQMCRPRANQQGGVRSDWLTVRCCRGRPICLALFTCQSAFSRSVSPLSMCQRPKSLCSRHT
jgi:hypothetical protein